MDIKDFCGINFLWSHLPVKLIHHVLSGKLFRCCFASLKMFSKLENLSV